MNTEIKKQYELVQKKHSLPDFSKLDDYFDVSKVESEGSRFLRDIRKAVTEKIVEYTRLIEFLINPSNAPGMFAQFAKVLSYEDRKLLERVYEGLVNLELRAIECDLGYDELKECELLRMSYDFWHSSFGDLKTIVGLMRRNFESKPTKKERMYFG